MAAAAPSSSAAGGAEASAGAGARTADGGRHSRVLSMAEVAQHDRVADCWVVIHQRAYDLTSFIHTHPGGVDIIAACRTHRYTTRSNATRHLH